MISFFGVPRLRRVAEPDVVAGNGLRIAALIDLAGTKASVIQVRAEAKDYVDIDAYFADGNLATLSEELKDRLAAAARNVDLDRL